MPAVSKSQRRLFAIAEHHPEALYDRNKGLASMSKSDLHDYATTPEKGLPYRQHKKSETKKRKVYGEK
jgi:hypothetical protein